MAVTDTSFTANGDGAIFAPTTGVFNASLSGTWVGTVVLDRGVPNMVGVMIWTPVTVDTAGAIASFTANASFSVAEPEAAARYRWRVYSYTSGIIVGRFGP